VARSNERRLAESAAASEAEDGSLIREARHAAGNLVHRMYYWTGLLEDAALDASASEALAELRTSLAGLHRLVGRTMDLVRPVHVATIDASVADVVTSVLQRFGRGDALIELPEDVRTSKIRVDPILVDRAIGMLAELIPCSNADEAAGNIAPAAVRVLAQPTLHGLLIEVQSQPSAARVDPSQGTGTEIGVALARKLLAPLGWTVSVSETERAIALRIFVPVRDHVAASVSIP
jgi:hypothetical protein